MAQNTLSDEVKTFIVQQLACFDAPSAVVRAVKEEFDGLAVTPQQVEAYDPTKRAGRFLSEGYRAIFTSTRDEFLTDTARIGVSHRAVRLRTLQRLAEKAEKSGNLVLVASLMEQAAKESGGAFTNKREVGGLGGGPIQTETTVKPDLAGLDQAGRDALRTVLEQVAGGSAGNPAGA